MSYKPTQNAQGPRILGWSGGLVGACQARYRADQPPVSVPAAMSVVPVCVTKKSMVPLCSEGPRAVMHNSFNSCD